MNFEIKITGVQGAKQALRAFAAKVPDQAKAALRQEAEEIMTRSKRDHVPVDLGTLRSSGHVKPAVRRGKDIEVTLAYGGAASPYALAVHEHPSQHSPPSWQGRGAEEILSVRQRRAWNLEGRGPKYLERPMRAAVPGMAKRIADKIGGEV